MSLQSNEGLNGVSARHPETGLPSYASRRNQACCHANSRGSRHDGSKFLRTEVFQMPVKQKYSLLFDGSRCQLSAKEVLQSHKVTEVWKVWFCLTYINQTPNRLLLYFKIPAVQHFAYCQETTLAHVCVIMWYNPAPMMGTLCCRR